MKGEVDKSLINTDKFEIVILEMLFKILFDENKISKKEYIKIKEEVQCTLNQKYF